MRESPRRQFFLAIEPLEARRLMARPLGIDVSDHQGDITPTEWTQIKNSGREFAFTKATEGVTFNATTFSTNMTRAKAAGLLIGAYHFGRPDNNAAVAEADHFIQIITPFLTPGFLRPVLDIETDAGDVTFMSNWVNAFCNRVKAVTGLTPLIYTGQSFAASNFNSSVTQWPLWMARWPASPDPQGGSPGSTTPWTSWAFWQYSSTGSVPGISGNCDLDVFNGTTATLQQYVIGPPEVSVLRGATPITSGQAAAIDFGSVMQNQTGPSITFTVRNDGGQTLDLGPVNVPSGYTLTEGLNSSLLSGAFDTFTVRLDSLTLGTKSGNISFSTNDSDENPFTFPITGMVTPGDTTAPEVVASMFLYENSPHKISFTFSESVESSISFDDLVVENLTNSTTLSTSSFSMVYNAANHTATFTYNAGILADASFRATLPASRIFDASGNHLASDYVMDFHFLVGDANNDGAVTLSDFNIVAANFGQSPRNFVQGDFNYDGEVTLNDFNVLASRFGTSVAPAPGMSSRILSPVTKRSPFGASLIKSLDETPDPLAIG